MKSLFVILMSALFVSGCGTKYTYKPVSYMSQDKTYAQAKDYCEYVSEKKASKLDVQRREKAAQRAEERERKRAYAESQRISYPDYKTECIKSGNYISCESSPESSTLEIIRKAGKTSSAIASKGASMMVEGVGGMLGLKANDRANYFKDCMRNEGYKRVKVKKR